MADSPQKEVEGEDNAQASPSAANAGNNATASEEGEGRKEDMDDRDPGIYESDVKEQDRWLPIANVARIMKTALPDNAKIAKEAKECMQECVSEFISFITSEASEKCQHEKRKTVNGEDILFAMTSLGFENYSEALKIYLSRYRDASGSRTADGQLTGSSDPQGIESTGIGGMTGGSVSVDGMPGSAAGAVPGAQTAGANGVSVPVGAPPGINTENGYAFTGHS